MCLVQVPLNYVHSKLFSGFRQAYPTNLVNTMVCEVVYFILSTIEFPLFLWKIYKNRRIKIYFLYNIYNENNVSIRVQLYNSHTIQPKLFLLCDNCIELCQKQSPGVLNCIVNLLNCLS